jgi:hypothetical protein
MVFHVVDALRLHIVAWFLLVAAGVVLAFFCERKTRRIRRRRNRKNWKKIYNKIKK